MTCICDGSGLTYEWLTPSEGRWIVCPCGGVS